VRDSTRRTCRALALAALAVAVSGCVSLLPKSEPAQLYTFGRGWPAPAPAAAAFAGDRIGVLLAPLGFPRAAQGDELLTLTGTEAAYIGESRWVAPAVVLFREAVEGRFEEAGQRTRLVGRGDIGGVGLLLRLDVRQFEAVYPFPDATPEVAVSVRGTLTRVDGGGADERTFAVRRPAAENRVSAIVAGLDEAAREVVDEVVAWTDAAAAAMPVAAPPAVASRTATTTP